MSGTTEEEFRDKIEKTSPDDGFVAYLRLTDPKMWTFEAIWNSYFAEEHEAV